MAIPLPKELFHGTNRKYLDSIMKEGIIPNKNRKWILSKNKVYLAAKSLAKIFSADFDNPYTEEDRILLKINVNKLQKDKITVDSNCFPNPESDLVNSWEYDGVVPSEAIEEVIDITF